MKPGLCLFTDSTEPSGMGELMLTLAAELRHQYQLFFVCPPSHSGRPLLRRASALGIDALGLDMAGNGDPPQLLRDWLRRRRVRTFHDHAGIGWEGQSGVYIARAV